MKRVTIIIEVLILVVLTGCGKSKEESIVGKWKEAGGTETIEFFKDGTVTFLDKGEMPLTGDYRFLDQNRIRMDLKGLGELMGPVIAEISASADEITFTIPYSGKLGVYRKLKEGQLLGKEDRTVSVAGPPTGMGWELIWEPKGSQYSPTLTLIIYAYGDDVLGIYSASDGKRRVQIPSDFKSFRADFWYRSGPGGDDFLERQEGAELIRFDKVTVWGGDERTICPGEVTIWNKYRSRSRKQDGVLVLKKSPNFKPAGWKRLTGCDGLCYFLLDHGSGI